MWQSAQRFFQADSILMANLVINIESRIAPEPTSTRAAAPYHDSIRDDFIHIGLGVLQATGVTVRVLNWLGVGEFIRQVIQVGPPDVIGADTAVVKPVARGINTMGVARSLGSAEQPHAAVPDQIMDILLC